MAAITVRPRGSGGSAGGPVHRRALYPDDPQHIPLCWQRRDERHFGNTSVTSPLLLSIYWSHHWNIGFYLANLGHVQCSVVNVELTTHMLKCTLMVFVSPKYDKVLKSWYRAGRELSKDRPPKLSSFKNTAMVKSKVHKAFTSLPYSSLMSGINTEMKQSRIV